MNEKAAEIGREHGRAAGEAWLAEAWWADSHGPNGRAMADRVLDALNEGRPSPDPLPVPDLAALYACGAWATDVWDDAADAYEAAFTAAVEATVREACGEVAT